MSLKNILVFMSDQHSPVVSSYMGGMARTPNLERLCEDGTTFTEAYTSCPLCVPARLSMLLGHLPSKSGIFTNEDAIPERDATFLHSLVAAGYETVLIGRMHFVGTNQRQGFTKRLVGDMTPVTWSRPSKELAKERGVFKRCFGEPYCLDAVGGGDSPVLEYDKKVIKSALEYLLQPHDKPQCIFVGTYGPHFPYCAPPELYSYYKDKVDVPESFDNPPEYLLNPVLKDRLKDVTHETVKRARAAYFGMIEEMDRKLGLIREAFNKSLILNGKQGVFVYISDHGDHAGDKKIFGKKTFFESSAKIPMIFEGLGINKNQRISIPASIMDLGPTLCELAGTMPPPAQDGKSLVKELHGDNGDKERVVISELMECKDGNSIVGRMIRKGKYKYITYVGYEDYDMLFNIKNDPEEKINLAGELKDELCELKKIAFDGWDPKKIIEDHENHMKSVKLVKDWELAVGPNETERWKDNPEYARIDPKVK